MLHGSGRNSRRSVLDASRKAIVFCPSASSIGDDTDALRNRSVGDTWIPLTWKSPTMNQTTLGLC